MFRYLLPLALCFALLAAASAHALSLDHPVEICEAERGKQLRLEQDEINLNVTLSFPIYGDEVRTLPVIYNERGLVVAANASGMLVLRRAEDGQLSLRAGQQQADGALGTKSSFYAVTCSAGLRF